MSVIFKMEAVLPVRRRSYGSIRSPNVKRDNQSIVVIKGWLFKLEGGALKQWKRRWCVLSDFCLFFYKSPDEDKVFSSVLLPSCKVSPCSSEDRISKKFAFKVEHQNMKTYFFASEDKENMKRWMNAMSLASIMQNPEKTEKMESGISSTSYEEEDSGFTSYRSRHYYDQDPNSTFDGSHYSDGMKQRSHSCSDRVNEMYLNNDDKYPTFPTNSQQYYSNSTSKQNIPRRQPLYANAPPKPRRLTQSEPFAIAPTDQYDDGVAYVNHRQIPYQYQEAPGVFNYPGYPHLTYSDPVVEMDPIPYQDYRQETNFQQTIPYSNSYPSQSNPEDLQEIGNSYERPPRPHSADFLERETECFSPSTKDHKTQPRRPKSSLEYCDKYWETEESNNHYDYHKGVNNDDPYINQNNHLHGGLQPYDDQFRNLNYNIDQPYFDSAPPVHSYPQNSKYLLQEQPYQHSYPHNSPSTQPIKKKKAHEESMKRLMEWKQRMLQSPLSRRNAQYSSSSSDAGSPRRLPGQQLPNYHAQVMRDLAAHEARVRQKSQHMHTNIQPSSDAHPVDQYYRSEFESNASKNLQANSSPPPTSYQQSFNNTDSIPNSGRSNREIYSSVKVEQTNKTCHMNNQQNILYCVDSENNELLIYGDNYVTDVPNINEEAYYSQKRCNVGNIMSNTKAISSKAVSAKNTKITGDNTDLSQSVKDNKIHSPSKETFVKVPQSQHCVTSYSSDDEDNEEKFSRASGSLKKIETATVVEIHEPRPEAKASPDYVNISIVNKSHCDVSPCLNDERNRLNKMPGKTKHPSPMYFSDEIESQQSGFDGNLHEQILSGSSQSKLKGILDMNREDYHRACQVFFSSSSKNNTLHVPSCKSPESSPSYSSSSSVQKGKENKYKQSAEILDLDKDVGLPLPPVMSTKYPAISQEKSNSSVATHKSLKTEVDCTIDEDHSLQTEFLGLSITKPHIECINENISNSKSHFIDSLVTKSLDNLGLLSSKKHVSFEELRLQLQRQREAPPPNIVQERIKRFECTESKTSNSQEVVSPNVVETGSCKLEAMEIVKNKKACKVDKVSKRKFKHKNTQQSKIKRTLHSDTEAVVVQDSGDSCSDDMTMKSAPILLSPLSSVLADLRKTADNGKEEIKKIECDFEKVKLKNDEPKVVDINLSAESEIKLKYETEEAYLSMEGLRNAKESEYVAMDDSLTKSNVPKPIKESVVEEPVYNEPLSPPQSFLHGTYGKQKGRNVQFETDTSSSDESSSEHIYEKPRHAVTASEPSLYKGGNHRSSKPEFKPQLNQNFFLGRNINRNFQSNSRSAEQIGSNISPPNDYKSFCQSTEMLCSSNKHMVQAHMNQSVPDLLQLQDIKDSEASDADDEASRDFDTSVNLQLPAYQSVTFSQDENTAETASSISRYEGHSSFDSEIMSLSLNQDISSKTSNSNYSSISFNPPVAPYVPPYCTNMEVHDKNVVCSQRIQQPAEAYDTNAESKDSYPSFPDDGKKIHLRKLRIYTKGRKPESSKLSSMPYNFEGPELAVKGTKKGSRSEFVATTASECYSPLKIDCDSMTTFVPPHLSFVPDVIPSECIDEKKTTSPDKESSFNRSPNSAPYYYSDLLPEGHIFNVADFVKRNEFGEIPKGIVTKPSQVMLNNVVCKSPTFVNKGDIGRRVNKISTKSVPMDIEKVAMNNAEKTFIKNDSLITVADLKHSLDSFYTSESKYLDAERNKYEAGHTLEKTRRMNSTLTYLKQRSSTPDLKATQYQAEPVYENLTLRKTALHKRLSCSLEAISKPPDYPPCNPETDIYAAVEDLRRESPVYENLTFFHQFSESKLLDKAPPSPLPSHQPHVSKNLYFDPKSQVGQKPVKKYVDIKSASVHNSSSSYTYSRNDVDNFDADTNYLNQNELRRVSQQYFLGHFKEKTASKLRSRSNLQSMELSDLNRFDNREYPHDDIENDVFIEGQDPPSSGQDLHSKRTNFAPDKIPHAYETDENSSSYSSSSSDEASVDTEYVYKQKNSKSKICLNQTKNVSDSEIQVREPCHLKKLVQLSEGVMNKGKRLSVSAGDLLGKTHEELVLLLIQLRRNQARIVRAKEKCLQQLENVQQFSTMNECMKQMYTKNFSELMQQVTLLEKQFEATRPLINLVDNMVKLGSLYGSNDKRSSSYPHLETSCDFSSSQERVYVNMPLDSHAWSSTEETELQGHLNEMRHLDKGLSRETHSFSSLQQDKEMLEYTLHGMKNKILDHQDKPIELQKLRKQQRMIEKELTRVKRLLSHSAKKIEDATTKNDQLEQQILLLRQKLQQVLKTGSSELKSSQARADLEAELSRVQNVLEELANHRQEISNTVETLKSDCQTRVALCSSKVRASPTGVAGSAPLPLRKKQQSTYFETDLDTMQTYDLSTIGRDADDIPVYANADELNNSSQESANYEKTANHENGKNISSGNSDKENISQCPMQDINEADDKMKRFYGILPREKPCEIKTVRIVKRQSERRNKERDKKRVTYGDQSSIWVVEEPDFSSDDHIETDEETFKKTDALLNCSRPTSIPLMAGNTQRQPGYQSARERLFGSSGNIKTDDELTLHKNSNSVKSVKRSKRRHYTVSGCQYSSDPQFSEISRGKPRSRDDVDMERCLRTANTPDIVRSTIKKKEVYDEKIIERELGLPQKIKIPERYIEDEPERLSASEKLRRSRKAENIRKMLSETTATYENVAAENTRGPPEKLHEKCTEQKRKRAHLLALNHALAQEVMQRSKAVAVLATFEHLIKGDKPSPVEDLSPMVELPITQQRYNMLC